MLLFVNNLRQIFDAAGGGGNDFPHFYIDSMPYLFGILKYLGGPT